MGDRRHSFPFRFWSSSASASRRTSATRTTAKTTTPPSSTTPPAAETSSAGQTTTPTTPSTAETQSVGNANTPSSTTPPAAETSSAGQTTTPTTPSTAETQSPASPFHATTKSRSPPQPSSPSRAAPQSRATPSPPSRMGSLSPLTPQRSSQPRSPSRPASHSPKQTSSPSTKGVRPTSTSKELQHTTQEIFHPLSNSHEAPNTVSNGVAPKPSASEQEPREIQPKTKVKSNTVDDSHNQTAFETSTKHNEMEAEPSKSSELGAATISNVAKGPEIAEATQKLDSSRIDGETKPLVESNAKPEDVKDVIQETKCETNGKRNNEGNGFPTANSGSRAQTVEEASIINKSEQMHEETQGALGKKEILPTSLFNGKLTKTSSRPGNKSISVPTQKISTQSSREQVPLHKEIRDDISTFVNRMAIEDPRNSLNDRPVSVITLAGENRGASMQLGSDSSKGEGAVHIHRGYKINPDESPEATTDGEGNWKGKKSEDAEGKEDQPIEAYVNNNAQGINNSIVFNGSMTERNPGVHMIVTRASKEPTKLTDERRPIEMQKAEFNMIPAQRLTYEPTVRRRCLRGLFLESSDSDPENPEKPQRHGCRVGCKGRSK
ncbi:hypothetical protein Fot_55940 [Forsythia ovata]|uniref:Uncharacterized protein n=1 Tax=Forsythia ovata TaxID=205694 RepID=A0ABD1P2I1_9LAMI